MMVADGDLYSGSLELLADPDWSVRMGLMVVLEGVAVGAMSNPDNLSLFSWQHEATILGVPYLVRGSPVSTGAPDCAGTVWAESGADNVQPEKAIRDDTPDLQFTPCLGYVELS